MLSKKVCTYLAARYPCRQLKIALIRRPTRADAVDADIVGPAASAEEEGPYQGEEQVDNLSTYLPGFGTFLAMYM